MAISEPPSPTSLHLITALRYDNALLQSKFNADANGGESSAFLLLPYHFARLLAAAKAHGPEWVPAAQLLTLAVVQHASQAAVEECENGSNGPFKIRVALAPNGTLSATATPVGSISHPDDPFYISTLSPHALASCGQPPLTLFLAPATSPTSPSIYTRTKTTFRAPYDTARSQAGVTMGAQADVLLFDTQDRLMEASIRNVALWQEGKWVTPGDGVGCLPGVARRWLIEKEMVVCDEVGALRRQHIVDGEVVLTFNAVEGCRFGYVQINPTNIS